jgi:hypothetical protein
MQNFVSIMVKWFAVVVFGLVVIPTGSLHASRGGDLSVSTIAVKNDTFFMFAVAQFINKRQGKPFLMKTLCGELGQKFGYFITESQLAQLLRRLGFQGIIAPLPIPERMLGNGIIRSVTPISQAPVENILTDEEWKLFYEFEPDPELAIFSDQNPDTIAPDAMEIEKLDDQGDFMDIEN